MNTVSTAYDEKTARDYDAKRFTTKSGDILNQMEVRLVTEAIHVVGNEFDGLEIGCGTGRFTHLVAKHARRLVAIEPSPHMMQLAMHKCKDCDNVVFEQGEGAQIRHKDNTFDFTYSIRVTNQTESREYAMRLVAEMVRVTKEGGFVLVEACNASRWLQRKTRTVRLGLQDFQSVDGVSICQVRGLLAMSLTALSALEVTPRFVITCFSKIDEWMTRRWPWAGSRVYVLLKKEKAG